MFDRYPFNDTLSMRLFFEVALTLVATVYGVVAVWVVLGRGRWYLRAGVAATLIAAWLPVPAYELCLGALAIQAVTLAPLCLVRAWNSRRCQSSAENAARVVPGRWQFGIRDLLAVMVFAGLLSGFVVHVPAAVWPVCRVVLVLSVPLGLAMLLAAWAALGRRWRWLRLVAVLAVPYALPAAGWLATIRRAGLLAGWPAKSAASAVHGRVACAAISACILLPCVGLWGVLMPKSPIPQEQFSPTNGYAELRNASRECFRLIYPRKQGTAWHAATIQAATPMLEQGRSAMQEPCYVPVDYHETFRGVLSRITDAGFGLCAAWGLQARVAESEGRIDDALAACRQMLLLVPCVTRGGLSYDQGAGLGAEFSAWRELHRMRDRLTAEQCRRWIAIVTEQERAWEAPEIVLARTRAWNDRVLPWYHRWKLLFWENHDPDFGLFPPHLFQFGPVHRQLMTVELALRAYYVDHGRWPEHLEELVPACLPDVPQDPCGHGPLVYRRDGTGYVLYSVGFNGLDDGGVPVRSGTIFDPAAFGDLSLKSLPSDE